MYQLKLFINLFISSVSCEQYVFFSVANLRLSGEIIKSSLNLISSVCLLVIFLTLSESERIKTTGFRK